MGLGRDQMRDLGCTRDIEAVNRFLQHAVGIGHAFVLPQVLEPRVHLEDFDETPCRLDILEDAPVERAVAPPRPPRASRSPPETRRDAPAECDTRWSPARVRGQLRCRARARVRASAWTATDRPQRRSGASNAAATGWPGQARPPPRDGWPKGRSSRRSGPRARCRARGPRT